jgi:predicted  nucleic acid-binding Zn-ribbon protein
MVRIADLFALQEIDSAIDAAERQLTEIREQLTQESGLGEARARVAELEAELTESTSTLHSAEDEVEDGRAKVTEVEAKLYGGAITSSRELRDLQKDLEALQRLQQAREERALAVMTRVEGGRSEHSTLRQQIDEGQAAWTREQERLTAEQARLEGELDALRMRRQTALRPIDSTTMSLYERIRRMRGGRAVARVQRGACQGCHISLPSTVFQKARSGMVVVQCSSCERILFVG